MIKRDIERNASADEAMLDSSIGANAAREAGPTASTSDPGAADSSAGPQGAPAAPPAGSISAATEDHQRGSQQSPEAASASDPLPTQSAAGNSTEQANRSMAAEPPGVSIAATQSASASTEDAAPAAANLLASSTSTDTVGADDSAPASGSGLGEPRADGEQPLTASQPVAATSKDAEDKRMRAVSSSAPKPKLDNVPLGLGPDLVPAGQWGLKKESDQPPFKLLRDALHLCQGNYVGANPLQGLNPALEAGAAALECLTTELLYRAVVLTALADWLKDRAFEAGADEVVPLPGPLTSALAAGSSLLHPSSELPPLMQLPTVDACKWGVTGLMALLAVGSVVRRLVRDEARAELMYELRNRISGSNSNSNKSRSSSSSVSTVQVPVLPDSAMQPIYLAAVIQVQQTNMLLCCPFDHWVHWRTTKCTACTAYACLAATWGEL